VDRAEFARRAYAAHPDHGGNIEAFQALMDDLRPREPTNVHGLDVFTSTFASVFRQVPDVEMTNLIDLVKQDLGQQKIQLAVRLGQAEAEAHKADEAMRRLTCIDETNDPARVFLEQIAINCRAVQVNVRSQVTAVEAAMTVADRYAYQSEARYTYAMPTGTTTIRWG
jgi:hypothetical protein